MTTSATTQLPTLPQPSSSPRGKKICMSGFCTPHKIFYLTQVQVSVSINADPINTKTQLKSQERKSWLMKLKDILYQPKQAIDINKYNQPAVILVEIKGKPLCQ